MGARESNPLGMPFRYPDKPTRAKLSVLATLRDGDWLAQLKHDGWRALISWDGRRVRMVTRTNHPIEPGRGLARELACLLAHQPGGLLMDGEWMGMRRMKHVEGDEWAWRRCREGEREELVLFDLLQVAGVWVGEVAAVERFRGLRALWSQARGSTRPRHVRIVRCRMGRYRELFDEAASTPMCEGVVLKHKQSRIAGRADGCFDNPRWIKVKHPHREPSQGRAAPQAKASHAESR